MFGRKARLPEDWQILEQTAQLEAIDRESEARPVAIFKHSTSCGISHHVKDGLMQAWDFAPDEIGVYYLDLLQYRPVSNAVMTHYGVQHQSPQLLLIKNGKAVYHASHQAVSVPELRKALAHNA